MSHIDMAIGLGLFLFFFGLVTMLSIQHFAQIPTIMSIREYREAAMNMFQTFFETEGAPSDWEKQGGAPSQLGLSTFVYRVPISVKETGVSDRLNEPAIANVIFDRSCNKDARQNSVRVYDENLNEVQYDLFGTSTCQSGALETAYVKFKTNVTKNERQVFYVYYMNDTQVPSVNYAITYNTPSWTPSSGDAWTESTQYWSSFGNTQVSEETDSMSKVSGTNSISVYGGLVEDKIGLKYDPTASITGITNGMYLYAWLKVDNLDQVSGVKVLVSDGTDTIDAMVESSELSSGTWYKFEKELSASNWNSWETFDASNGIDSITFHIQGTTSSIERGLKVDSTHFGLNPMEVVTYPQQTIPIVSREKIDALGNLTYDELKNAIGERYKFRIEIIGG